MEKGRNNFHDDTLTQTEHYAVHTGREDNLEFFFFSFLVVLQPFPSAGTGAGEMGWKRAGHTHIYGAQVTHPSVQSYECDSVPRCDVSSVVEEPERIPTEDGMWNIVSLSLPASQPASSLFLHNRYRGTRSYERKINRVLTPFPPSHLKKGSILTYQTRQKGGVFLISDWLTY